MVINVRHIISWLTIVCLGEVSGYWAIGRNYWYLSSVKNFIETNCPSFTQNTLTLLDCVNRLIVLT